MIVFSIKVFLHIISIPLISYVLTYQTSVNIVGRKWAFEKQIDAFFLKCRSYMRQ